MHADSVVLANLGPPLAAKLAEVGVRDTAVNIRNKVSRGGFSAVFFVQCLKATGTEVVRLD